MFALMVDGGDMNTLKGVFDSEDKVHLVIQAILVESGCTVDRGFNFTKIADPDGYGGMPNETVYSAHDADDPHDYSIVFTVVSLELNQELNVAI